MTNETAPIRVVIADDQRVVRDGLELLLGLIPGVEVVATAGDGAEAIDAVEGQPVDVVLMDLRMPTIDGIEATRRLTASHPGTRVLILTTYADDDSLLPALNAGARGYLTKNADADTIAQAIHTVHTGGTHLDAHIQRRLIELATSPPPPATQPLPDDLTPREAEVLALIAEGRSNHEIATQLVVSAATVKTHINHIFSKTRCRDRAQLVTYAYTHRVASPPSGELPQ